LFFFFIFHLKNKKKKEVRLFGDVNLSSVKFRIKYICTI